MASLQIMCVLVNCTGSSGRHTFTRVQLSLLAWNVRASVSVLYLNFYLNCVPNAMSSFKRKV